MSNHEKRNCKAYGVEIFKCGERNHYARTCVAAYQIRKSKATRQTRATETPPFEFITQSATLQPPQQIPTEQRQTDSPRGAKLSKQGEQ